MFVSVDGRGGVSNAATGILGEGEGEMGARAGNPDPEEVKAVGA